MNENLFANFLKQNVRLIILLCFVLLTKHTHSQNFVEAWNELRQLPEDTLALNSFIKKVELGEYEDAIEYIDSIRHKCAKNGQWDDYLFHSTDIACLQMQLAKDQKAYNTLTQSQVKYKNHGDTLAFEYALSLSESFYPLMILNNTELKYSAAKRLYDYCKFRNYKDCVEVVIYSNISGTFADNMDYTKAHDCALESWNIVNQQGWDIWTQTPLAIFMGYLATLQGKDYIAINFYETSILANPMKNRKDSLYYIYASQGLVSLYLNQNLYSKCLSLSKKCYEINETLNNFRPHYIYAPSRTCFGSAMANTYLKIGKSQMADSLFNSIIGFEYSQKNHSSISSLHLSYGNSKQDVHDYSEALKYYNEAKRIYDSAKVVYKKQQFQYFIQSSKALLKLNKTEDATLLAQEGLFFINEQAFKSKNIDTLPKLKDDDLTITYLELLEIKTSALLQLYNPAKTTFNCIENHINTYLKIYKNALANNTDKSMVELLQKSYKKMVTEVIRLFATNKNIANSKKLLVANLVAQSRAQQLNNEINELEYVKQQDEKDDNLVFLNNLKSEILNLYNIRSLQNNDTQSYKEQTLKLSNLYIQLLYLESVAESRYSIDSISLLPDVDLITMQKKLNKREAIIEYALTPDYLFSYTVTKDTIAYHFGDAKNLLPSIKELNRDVKTGASTIENSKKLYSALLKPFEPYLNKNIEQLTIIPDEQFAQLPFEILFNKTNGLQYSILYNYSSSLFYNQRLKKSNPNKNNILVVAPVFESNKKTKLVASDNLRSTLITDESVFRDKSNPSALPSTLVECKAIEKLFNKTPYSNCKTLVKSEATKTNLLLNLSNKDIVHIASHGVVNKLNPFASGLLMAPENEQFDINDLFYHYELYNTKLSADLVVLSACKTGTGTIVEGEGVMALPRGFIYAGVPNVIASLWKVHDEKTKDLMVAFYKHLLENNVSYAEALRLAKLDCIEKGFLPVDWAGFVLIGN